MKQIIAHFFLVTILGSALLSCDSIGFRKKTLFKLLNPSHTGINFNNALVESNELNILTYQDFYSGGGVSIGDINNDGLADVFLTGNMVPAKLFLNLGNIKFQDITENAGLTDMGKGWYTGTTMVDINSDGFLDIYVSKSGLYAPEDRENLLFINNRDNTFSEKGEEYGINHSGYAVNATFFDYDKDGDLDMFLVNQGPEKFESGSLDKIRKENHPYCGDKLFENIGDKFIDVTDKAGIISSLIGFGHGVSVGDLNRDGWEDVFVSNDFFEHDYIYLNNGDKTFREVCKVSMKHISNYSMGNDMADYNNDGLLDIVVVDMVAEGNRRLKANLGGMNSKKFQYYVEAGFHHQYMFNTLHYNNGNTTFSEIGMLAGISNTDWSWGPLFADFDNDGWKDLFVSNGIRKDIRNIDWGNYYKEFLQLSYGTLEFSKSDWDLLLNSMPSEKVSNYIYKNNQDLTFSKVMDTWGMDQPSFSNGAAYGDLDDDGDLDLIVNNIDDEVYVYENRTNEVDNKNYIKLYFNGPPENPKGLGTSVRLYIDGKVQFQQLYVTRGYRSSMEPMIHFGLDDKLLIDSLEIIWPDNRLITLKNINANQNLFIDYTVSKDTVIFNIDSSQFIFNDVTKEFGLDHKHMENEFDDFSREPMLPHKFSNLGPGLAVGDINKDGLDDFYVCGALRYAGSLYVQTKEGQFNLTNEELFVEDRNYEDIDASFFDVEGDGDLDLYVVSGGSEFKLGIQLLKDRLYLNEGDGSFIKSTDALPDLLFSGSKVQPADYDSDGDIDLFVGGRLVPGEYPKPASSYILMNEKGKFKDVTQDIAPELNNIGLVTSACWTDYDNDNDLDLVVAGEWLPIQIFQNKNGRFIKYENLNNGLEASTGWWWSIVAHDFDGDGDEDLVAGNMGLNFTYKASPEGPFEVYRSDFDKDGNMDIVLGYYNEGVLYPVKGLYYSVKQVPTIKEKYLTHNKFALATLDEIYGKEALNLSLNYKVKTFASAYIENKSDGNFEMVPFENLAQFSNVNSIIIKDFDEDGFDDLLLAGNFYSSEVEAIRSDAGTGIWLRGDGNGNFKAIPNSLSGLFIDGDVKDIEEIRVKSAEMLLIAKNRDYMQLIKPGDK